MRDRQSPYRCVMIDIIKTSRCYLTPLSFSDIDKIEKLYTNSDVREHLGGVSDTHAIKTNISEMIKCKDELHLCVYLEEKEKLIGLISFDQYHDKVHYQLSYQFFPEYWGNGYALETIRICFENVFDFLKINEIVAETQSKNTKSRNLLEKLNMKKIKEIRRFNEEQTVYFFQRRH